MSVEFSAKDMIELIDALFEGRETVNKYDIVEKAKFYPLGRDGERAVQALPPRRYNKADLTEAMTAQLIEVAGN